MYRSIGESVKIARERMGLSQSQIAEYLGAGLSYIDMCELDQCSFSVDMLEKLADLFGCDYEDLENGMDIYPDKNITELLELEMDAIASVNKIVSNIIEMKRLLRKDELNHGKYLCEVCQKEVYNPAISIDMTGKILCSDHYLDI